MSARLLASQKNVRIPYQYHAFAKVQEIDSILDSISRAIHVSRSKDRREMEGNHHEDTNTQEEREWMV